MGDYVFTVGPGANDEAFARHRLSHIGSPNPSVVERKAITSAKIMPSHGDTVSSTALKDESILPGSGTKGIKLSDEEPIMQHKIAHAEPRHEEEYLNVEMERISKKIEAKVNAIAAQLDKHRAKISSVGLSKFNKAYNQREGAIRVLQAIEKKFFGRHLSKSENLELRSVVSEEIKGDDMAKMFSSSISRERVHEKLGIRQLTFLEDFELSFAANLELQDEHTMKCKVTDLQ